MLKKFSISLIIMSTFLYASIFVVSKQYNTSFFDEINNQLSRITAVFNKPQEVEFTKLVLSAIVNSEHPPADWDQYLFHNAKYSHSELFYYYKVWVIKTKLTLKQITSSYPIYSRRSENSVAVNMRYGSSQPVVRFPFFQDSKGNIVAGLFFPVNEKPLVADLNRDHKINHEDVVLAKKAR